MELKKVHDHGQLAALIKSCAASRDLAHAKDVHSLLHRSSLSGSTYLANLLIHMYGKCGGVEAAEHVFGGITVRNVYSWTLMFMAYARNGHLALARGVFDRMPEKDMVTWNAMVSAYCEHGWFTEARKVFERMPRRGSKEWKTLIAAYARAGHLSEAQGLFDRMPEKDVVAWTMMVGFYAQSGDLVGAKRLFDFMPVKDVPAWNALLTAYARGGHLEEAVSLFERMPDRDEVSWNVLMTAYVENGCLKRAREIFDIMPRRDTVSESILLAAYAQDRQLEQAEKLFESMQRTTSVTWNTMLAIYSRSERFDCVLFLFLRMHLEGMKPDEASVVLVLHACSNLSHVDVGRNLHAHLSMNGFLSLVPVGNALLDMYAKSGSLVEAKSTFDQMKKRDSVTWSSIISAYARSGDSRQARFMFMAMNLEGFEVNEIVLINILTACCHAGLLDEAQGYFVSITGDHGAVAWVDHYGCIVDLLSRAGRLQEAESLLNSMDYQPELLVAWKSFLAACKLQGHSDGTSRAVEVLKRVQSSRGDENSCTHR